MTNGPVEVMKVLVVDDDEGIRTTLNDIFKKKGYLVTTVGTGKEGLECVKKQPFHFAVLDIRLPDMSGHDLLKEIRKINFKINCIMITAFSEEADEDSLGNGAVAHLMKPLRIEDLIKIFERKK